MRSSRFTKLIGIPLATMAAASAIGACGSDGTTKAGAPTPTTRAKLVLATATAGVAADSKIAAPEPALYPATPPTYVLDGALADLGATAGVRVLAAHAVSAADVARIASALGMSGSPRPADDGFVLHDGDAFLTVSTIGGATTVDYYANAGPDTGSSAGSAGTSGSSEPAVDPLVDPAVSELPVAKPTPLPSEPMPVDLPLPTTPPPVGVPSADDAVSIAQTLLDKLGVLAGADWTHTVDVGDAVAISCAPNADCAAEPSTVSARTVTYRLAINGIDVPGIEWSVTIGEHGRVIAVYGTWADVQNPVDYPLRSTADAFADLKDGDAQFGGPQPLAASAAGAAENASDDAVSSDVAPDAGPDVAPVPQPAPAPAPVIHVTGVALGFARWDGVRGDDAVVYVVPTYRFKATMDDVAPYDIEVLALDPAGFDLKANVPSAGQEVEK